MSLEIKKNYNSYESKHSSEIQTTKRETRLEQAKTNLDSISNMVIGKLEKMSKNPITKENYSETLKKIQNWKILMTDAKTVKEQYYSHGFGAFIAFLFGKAPLNRAQHVIESLEALKIELESSSTQISTGIELDYKKILSPGQVELESQAQYLTEINSDFIKNKNGKAFDKDGWSKVIQKGWEHRETFSMKAVKEAKSIVVTFNEMPNIKFLYSAKGQCFVIFEDNLIAGGLSKLVCKGIDLDSGQKVACSKWKNSNPDLMQEQLDDAMKEASVNKKIKGSGITPKILASGTYEINGNFDHYVISECYDGNMGSLLQKMGNDLTFLDRLNLIKDSAKALFILHEKRIVHGDIKLQNFLYRMTQISKNIQRFAVAIIDFGLSRFIDKPVKADIPGGSIEYCSPQKCQLRQKKEKDITEKDLNLVNSPADDVWSFGLICYALLHNNLPWNKNPEWEGLSPTQQQNYIANLQEGWFKPEEGNKVEMMIARMLSVDPAKRPSMKQVHAFFDSYFMEEFIQHNQKRFNSQ